MDQSLAILQGLDVSQKPSSDHKAVIQFLADSTNDPTTKRMFLGLEPMENLPGYYRNLSANLLVKYDPNIDAKPNLMTIDATSQPRAKAILSPLLANQ